MMSHRLRAAVAGVPIVLLSTLLLASPALAADALRITSPVAGSSVSGPLTVEGEVAASRPLDVDLSLAPQVLGDCGAPAVTSRAADVDGAFSASIPTAGLADGTYCLIAVADDGRLSTVLADITVSNEITPGEEVDGFQLSTEALGGASGGTGASAAPLVASPLLGDLPIVGSAVLALTMALAGVVLGTGLWARRRSAA
jgi:hypothetical protein